MNLVRHLYGKVVMLLTLFIFFACNSPGSKEVEMQTKIEVTDFRGKKIKLNKPASRIVCLIESALSNLYMLNAQDHIVGIPTSVYDESISIQYAQLDKRIRDQQLPCPGNWNFVSLEKVIVLQPDLVIIWSSQQESIAAIEEKGIPVYAVFLKSIADVEKEIRDLATLTQTNERADSLILYTRGELSKISSKTVCLTPKSVYFMWAQGILETSGKSSTVNEMIEMAGAKNACTESEEHIVINKERLLEWDPELILMWVNSSLNPHDIIDSPELGYLQAVKNKQVFELPSTFDCDLWTLKYIYAVKFLAKCCYPESFSDIDLQMEKQAMMNVMYGQPLSKLSLK